MGDFAAVSFEMEIRDRILRRERPEPAVSERDNGKPLVSSFEGELPMIREDNSRRVGTNDGERSDCWEKVQTWLIVAIGNEIQVVSRKDNKHEIASRFKTQVEFRRQVRTSPIVYGSLEELQIVLRTPPSMWVRNSARVFSVGWP